MARQAKFTAVEIGALVVVVVVLVYLQHSARNARHDVMRETAADSLKDDAQDANARSLLRSGAMALEVHYSVARSFNGANPTTLASLEPAITWTTAAPDASAVESQVHVQVGTPPGGYTLTTRSGSGRSYAFTRSETASVSKTCAKGDAAKDCLSPTW